MQYVLTITVCAVLLASRAWAEESEPKFIDHGVAAAVSESRGVIAAATSDGTPVIAAMSYDIYEGASRTSLLLIDPATGATEQFWYPKKDAPSAPDFSLMTSAAGRFYVMLGDVFLEFDLDERRWSFDEDPGKGTAMSFGEGPDGTIYAGTYPNAHLLAFNPESRILTDLGRFDPIEKYPSSLAVDDAGWVYAGIGTARANVVAINTATKERRQLVEETDRGTGTGYVYRASDGMVYGRLPGKPTFRLHNGEAEPVDPPPAPVPTRSISWGRMVADFPGGGKIAAFSIPNKTLAIEAADGTRRTLSFDYESAGAGITSMTVAPDGTVYGSTCHPFRLFRLAPGTGAIENLGGLSAVGGGNFAGLDVRGTTVYGGEYAGGRLYAFDTTKPWNDSDDAEANPRMLVQYKRDVCRPRTALAHPDGRHVLYAGFAGYGLVGGGIGIWDAETNESTLLANAEVLPGHSVITLDALPNGDVACGTSIDTPGGATPVADTGRVLVLDWQTRTAAFSLEPVPGARDVNCVAVSRDGRVFGITNTSCLFALDVVGEQVTATADVSGYGNPVRPDQSLFFSPNGRLLLLLNKTLLEVSPSDLSVRELAKLPEAAGAGVALSRDRVYYAVGARIRSCRVPE
ncbi:MAG: hypothetical protein GY851_15190 [bacterium]|nr:hypothetical protein [bacterium]